MDSYQWDDLTNRYPLAHATKSLKKKKKHRNTDPPFADARRGRGADYGSVIEKYKIKLGQNGQFFQ